MPHLNGIEAAKRLRQADPMVVLVFVTNMEQYAICGYEVNAIDYLLKLVSWLTFRNKLEKAIRAVPSHAQNSLILPCEDGFVKVPVSGIQYLEKKKNYILYHTAQGEFRDRGSMTEMTALPVSSIMFPAGVPSVILPRLSLLPPGIPTLQSRWASLSAKTACAQTFRAGMLLP